MTGKPEEKKKIKTITGMKRERKIFQRKVAKYGYPKRSAAKKM